MQMQKTAVHVREHTVLMVQFLVCHQLLHHQLPHHQLEHAGTISVVALVPETEKHGADILRAPILTFLVLNIAALAKATVRVNAQELGALMVQFLQLKSNYISIQYGSLM